MEISVKCTVPKRQKITLSGVIDISVRVFYNETTQ